MNRVKVTNLWQSNGTQDVSLTTATQYWFVPPSISASGFAANTQVLTTYWFPVDVPSSVDYMCLQYTSKLELVTNVTAVTQDDVQIAAVGMMHVPENPNLNQPHTILANRTPPDFRNMGDADWSMFPLMVSRISCAKVNDDVNYATNLPAFGTNTGETAAPETHADHHRGCIFLLGNIADTQSGPPPLNRTPLTTDYPGWACWIHTRNSAVFGAGATFQPYPRISGYQKVWIAVAHTPRFSSGPGTVRITGSLDVVMLSDTPRSW